MPPPHFLYSFAGPVVADTSVVINLNATGCSEALLAALPNQVLIAEQVMWELQDQRSRQYADAEMLSNLVDLDLVRVIALGETAHEIWAELVSGSAATTLDDGEAATIAAAIERGGLALIDERKALRICASRFEEVGTGTTVDLLRHPQIQGTLPREELADAVFKAAYRARMGVQHHHAEWVLDLIGRERAELCSSLRRILRATKFAKPLPPSEVHEARVRYGFDDAPTG